MISNPVKDLSSTSALRFTESVDDKHRADIDGLRGLAVLAVVIFHAFPTHLSGGFLGVDVFFVLSGYLITSIIYLQLESGRFNFFLFYGCRIRRIFPSLITVLIGCYAIGWRILLPEDYKKLGAHITAGAGFLSNFLLWTESGYFDAPSSRKPLLHLWSLAIEEQFYILWPFILFISRKIKVNLLLLSVGLTLSSFILNVMRVKENSVQTFYWPTSRAWELTIGACLLFSSKRTTRFFGNLENCQSSFFTFLTCFGDPRSKCNILSQFTSIGGALLVVLPMYFLSRAIVFPGWWALAPTIGTSLVIWSGPAAWVNRFILSSRFLVGLGLISYPLYLWHWPLLVFTSSVTDTQTFENTRVIIVLISIILAWITYAFIENPLRFGSHGAAKCIFLCVSMLAIGTTGYRTYRMDGLSFRFPKIIQDLVNFQYNVPNMYKDGTCSLFHQQDESNFGKCVMNAGQPVSTALILWGDSFAAHLRPGIEEAKSDFRITQLNTHGCPPILGTEATSNPKCNHINHYVMKRIVNEKPNTVVLAARWSYYNWKNITNSIAALKNASVKNIYLVGPVPEWQNSLAKCLYEYYIRDPLHRIPERMTYGLIPGMHKLDATLSDVATKFAINYISPCKIFCNSDGCLTRIGNTSDTITALDYGHLTFVGSKFLVSAFPRAMLYST